VWLTFALYSARSRSSSRRMRTALGTFATLERKRPTSTDSFSDEDSQHAQLSCMGKWISSWCYGTWASFTKGQCVVSFYKETKLWDPTGDSWHFSGYGVEHCFASCPCGDSFPVRWCTTSHVPFLSAFLDREFHDRWIGIGRPFSPPSFSWFDSSGYFFSGSLRKTMFIVKKCNMRTR